MKDVQSWRKGFESRSLRRFAGRLGGQIRLKSIGHAWVEDDALLLEPEAARSELTNLSWGKAEVELFGPRGPEPTHVCKLEPEFGKKPLQIGCPPAQMQHNSHSVRIYVAEVHDGDSGEAEELSGVG